ncbi:MAG TPA: 3-deoxy-7-phosphoheptulonate synthase [Thermomicrobiales bacterium]|nr:3-deoxy-7-phosphoheptulonate synthase [Thermomicrobiales bacterium]
MIVIMKLGYTQEELDRVVARIHEVGLRTHLSVGDNTAIVGVVGVPIPPELQSDLEVVGGVEEVLRVTKRYKLPSREYHPESTSFTVRGVTIGGDDITIVAGPCSVESTEQTLETARAVKAAGATILRGGAFKPRTSPYEFRGLGEEGLKILDEARAETGMPIITEVLTTADVDLVARYTDIFQIGARNCQNFLLLEEVGKTGIPVMVKRGPSVQIEEWLMAAEYVMAQGNPNVIMCERGIRTFETYTRFTFDLNAVPTIKKLSHLPIFADPSHATGKWHLVPAMALASIAAGADGLMIEVHPNPDHARSDGAQSLTFENFAKLIPQLQSVARAVGRNVPVADDALILAD